MCKKFRKSIGATHNCKRNRTDAFRLIIFSYHAFTKIDNGIGAGGIEPMNGGVFGKPGDLLLGIDAGVLGNAGKGEIEGPSAVEHLE